MSLTAWWRAARRAAGGVSVWTSDGEPSVRRFRVSVPPLTLSTSYVPSLKSVFDSVNLELATNCVQVPLDSTIVSRLDATFGSARLSVTLAVTARSLTGASGMIGSSGEAGAGPRAGEGGAGLGGGGRRVRGGVT